MEDDHELLDLVDSDDKVVGSIERAEVKRLFSSREGYVRYSECFIENLSGELWIPRRTMTKKIAPGGLDFSASEHVQAGESYSQAIIRGLEEELALKVSAAEIENIGTLSPIDGRPFFCQIYRIHRDSSPAYNKNDFVGFEWLRPSDVLNRLNSGETAKLDLADAIELLIAINR